MKHTHTNLYLWLKEFKSWDPKAHRKGFRLVNRRQRTRPITEIIFLISIKC